MGKAGQRRTALEKMREEVLLVAVLAHPTATRAAAAAGVSERTVRRALGKPAFAKRLDQLRRQRMEMALSSLASLADEALDAVKRSLSCGQPAVELRAAALVLLDAMIRGGVFLMEMKDVEDLKQQVATLQQQQREETFA